MSQECAASIFKTQNSSVEKKVIRTRVHGREDHLRALGGLRRNNDTNQSQSYSEGWWNVGAEKKRHEEGKAVNKNELTF